MTIAANSKVTLVADYPKAPPVGWVGVVRKRTELSPGNSVYAVEFEVEFGGGTDCGKACARRRGAWLPARVLKVEGSR